MENSFTLYKGCWLSKCPPHSSCYLKIDKCGKLLNRGGYLLGMFMIGIASMKLHFGLS